MITPLIMKPEVNLSVAWANAFLDLMRPGQGIRHPSVVSVSGFTAENIEDIRIREKLDQLLVAHGEKESHTVSGTIFPSSMWNASAENDDQLLYNRYENAWPGIAKCPANRNGVYFRRLTAYLPDGNNGNPVNQLKKIIDTFKGGNHRKSALQACIFDPTHDHSNKPYLGFPCLQQVTFTPLNNTYLSITGFYAKQLHIEKAYGNYFGLYELGRFMAKQMDLELSQVVCIASCLEMSEIKKDDLRALASDIEALLKDTAKK